MQNKILNYIKLMRIHHCMKNLLIFFPIIFNGSFFEPVKLINAIVGFIAFSLLASTIYIINDIQDVDKDRLHPKKRYRPIASGAVTVSEGKCLAISLFCLSMLLNWQGQVILSYIWLLLYWGLNVLYSKGLKNVPIIDIVILASGFLIRLVYGATITNIVISGWLYLTVLTAAFYMGLGKRRNELGKSERHTSSRGVLKYYNYAFLDKNMYMCLGLAEAFYALWAISLSKNTIMIWTVPIMIILAMKYSLDIEKDSDGDPVEVIIHDKALWGLCLIYAIIVMGAIYIV